MENNPNKICIGDIVLIYLDTSKDFFYLAIVDDVSGGGIYAEWNIGVYDFFLLSNYKIIIIDNGK